MLCALAHVSLSALDYLIAPTSPTEAQVCANRVALAQKRGYACAVNYLEYPHIYHHLLLSETDYKPRSFSQFQIKKVHRKIPSYGQLFYVECPKNGMRNLSKVSPPCPWRHLLSALPFILIAIRLCIAASSSRQFILKFARHGCKAIKSGRFADNTRRKPQIIQGVLSRISTQ